jgi:FAD/FMN-containing dehydrogenase
MTRVLPRRIFVHGSVAVAVAAWSPAARSWAPTPGPGTISIPGLDGQLLVDPATLAAAADDFGHIVHRTPIAVLEPGSVDDIVKVVRFANAHGLLVAAARGIGASHSTQGQSQIQGGVIIDMSKLQTIHEINDDDALVDAGVHWSAILEETVPLGKSPPTLNDYIELSVGGTLSVGGIGGQAFRAGLLVDNVLELEVVTGRGERVTCSPLRNAHLFTAVRGGLGQFGIIVRARVRLVPVPPMVRLYTAVYADLESLTADQLALIEDHRFDWVEGSASPDGAGGFTFVLSVAKYFDPASPPDDAAELAGLHFVPGSESAADSTYFDFANMLAAFVAFLMSVGAWTTAHPWLNLFLPAEATVPFVEAALAAITPEMLGFGVVLLYPINKDRLTAPFVRVPEARQSFIFSVLAFPVAPTPAQVAAAIAQNATLFEACVDVGGKRYPIDSVPMTHHDWRVQLAPFFDAFADAKEHFDPNHVLTPGQGIF